MENLFNSPFMQKLNEFGQKLGANKFLSSLQGAMMSCMSVIMCGSVFQIICAVMGMFGVQQTDLIYQILYMPYNFTMGLISLWITGMLAFNYAKAVGIKSPIMTTVETLAVFTLTACFDPAQGASLVSLSAGFLGSTGMFIGFVVAFVTVQVDLFCQVKNIRIKMPDVCPPSLVNGMSAIIPSFINACIWLALSFAVWSATGGMLTVCSAFMAVLAAPLQTLLSVPGMFILALFATLMWCFGIHGTMLLMAVLMAPMIQAGAANAAAWMEGGADALVFYPVALFGSMALCGGTGNTLSLCLFGLNSKSEQIKAIARVGLVPGWFGINEPVTFGMPIMYNPILCIPYILNVQVVMLCTYLGYRFGFLQPAHVMIMVLMPMGFAQFLGTFRWQNAIWDYLMIIPSGLVWYPFFKVYEKQLIAQEAAAAAAE
ncbi:MAG: PTS transporter subunit EIIC [Firmicutes bacterium]|nr:PTS transporter subunit EIIC [Bacillota bacterium]